MIRSEQNIARTKQPSPPKQNPSSNRSQKSNKCSNMDDTYKDSLEGSANVSRDNYWIPDSLNNTALINKQLPVFGNSVQFHFKEKENPDWFSLDHVWKEEEETKKMDYKYVTNYPIKELLFKGKGKERSDVYYWFAAYDKLMSSKNIMKILNYYTIKEEKEVQTKTMIIQDFELKFADKSRPVMFRNKGGFVFIKLYYLTMKEINHVLNYVNRVEHRLTNDDFDFNNTTGDYMCIKHNSVNIFYDYLLCLGSFGNISMYTFSNCIVEYKGGKYHALSNKDIFREQPPKPKAAAKLVKYLLNLFPNYSIEFFITYLYGTTATQAIVKDYTSEIKALLLKKRIFSNTNNNTKTNDSSLSNVKINMHNNSNANSNKKKKFNVNLHNNTAASTWSVNIKNVNMKKPILPNKSFGSAKGIVSQKPMTNVFVVNRKMKSDIDFDCSDESSIISRGKNNQTTGKVGMNCDNGEKEKEGNKAEYMTPTKKKKFKYYS